jgi:hypothetical protein
MTDKKQLFIPFDLNSLMRGGDTHPLRNQQSIAALRQEYGEIRDGQQIWLFALTMNNDKYDPTIFPGTIRDIGKSDEDEYEIIVDEKDMEYLSESEQFKGCSIADIIGEEWFNELKQKHPEAF